MWNHEITGVDGNVFLFGVNIFEYEWIRTGEKVEIVEPIYNQKYIFPVYKVYIRGQEYEFAASEFSNCIWGFYTQK